MQTALVAALLAGATLAAFGLQPWRSYVKTASLLEEVTVKQIFLPPAQATTETKSAAPQIAENLDFSRSLQSNYAISRTFLSNADQHKFRPWAARVFKSAAALIRVNSTLLALAALYCMLIAYGLKDAPAWLRIGFAFLAPSVIETFGPQRNAYCDVILVPVLLAIAGMVFADERISKSVRAAMTTAIGLCVVAAVGPYFLSPGGTAIEAVSLARWYGLLLLANLYFLARLNRRLKTSADNTLLQTTW
ncbi:MAG: hypothetical protein KGN79_04480 [Acidobacteriota bacterium]|nr:hypothetical protein [Acidobacteriota bacterium]